MILGEEKKRWRFSVRSLIGLVTCVALSLGLLRIASSLAFDQDRIATIVGLPAVILLFGSIGGFCGQLWNRSTNSYWIGFVCGALGLSALLIVITILVTYSHYR